MYMLKKIIHILNLWFLIFSGQNLLKSFAVKGFKFA